MRCKLVFRFASLCLTLFLTTAFASIVSAQVVVDVVGSSGADSTATQFSATPSVAGELEFYAVQQDGDAMLSVSTLGPELYSARITMTGADGQPAHIDYLLDGVSGVGVVVDMSPNVDPNDPFVEFNASYGPGWIPGQDYIWIKDSAGTVHIPEDADGFIDTIEGILSNGNTIDTLIIKGHGSNDYIGCGPGAGLGCFGGDIQIFWEDPARQPVDITDTLDAVCDGDTKIRFRGCFTAPLGDSVEDALGDGTDCKGAVRFVIGIPFTPWGIGVYR